MANVTESRPRPKIVVITPVRNEAWTLPRFLATASKWADLIIIADQNSSDGSREICSRFEKVVVIANPDENFNESARQLLLIQKARELVPGPRLLFALDADEILAANAPCTEDWQRMLQASPGTLFRFEKPDLYPTPDTCIRYIDNPQPLAYMDDNSEHSPRMIHSDRVPVPIAEKQLVLGEIIVLHYFYMRPRARRAKTRLYSVIENVLGTAPVHRRVTGYRKGIEMPVGLKVEQTPREWLSGWEENGVDLRTVDDSGIPWQDIEILRNFKTHGVRRFWIEDIWDNDWEGLRQRVMAAGVQGMPDSRIQPPPAWMGMIRCLLVNATRTARAVARGWKMLVPPAKSPSMEKAVREAKTEVSQF